MRGARQFAAALLVSTLIAIARAFEEPALESVLIIGGDTQGTYRVQQAPLHCAV